MVGSFRVVHVIKGGDFRASYRRLTEGGEEFYAAERRGVEQMQLLGELAGSWTVLNGMTQEPFEERLTPHLHAVGLGVSGQVFERASLAWLNERRPSHVVLSSPMFEVMRWCGQQQVNALPLWADTFFGVPRSGGVRHQLRGLARRHRWTRRLRGALRDLSPRWAGNHNLAASWQLVRLGLPADHVVPYEQAESLDPSGYQPRGWDGSGPFRLVYVGVVSEPKGVPDLLDAVARLTANGRDVELSIVGGGDWLEPARRWVEQAGLTSRVHLRGRLPHAQVLTLLSQSQAAVVPSRHVYPEGLPLTLMEALAVRTPVVASDHPSWSKRLRHRQDALIYRSEQPADLARNIQRLMEDSALYLRLSQCGQQVYQSLRCPLVVHDLLRYWVRGQPEDDAALAGYSLGSGRYGGVL